MDQRIYAPEEGRAESQSGDISSQSILELLSRKLESASTCSCNHRLK